MQVLKVAYICAMLLAINPDNPQERKIRQVVSTLEKGGVIIYPTDTVYGLGCDILQAKAIKKICQLRQLDPGKANLTIVCRDISQLSEYTRQLDNRVFKLLKRNLPGPFTFLLKAGKKLPKSMHNRRQTLGIRIPDNRISQEIIRHLGRPILSISLKADDEILEYFTDPTEIYDDYGKQVDLVIDGGIGRNIPSAVVNLTEGEIEIIREGERDLLL